MKLEVRKHDPIVWDDWLWYYYDIPMLDKTSKLHEVLDLVAEICRIELETTLSDGLDED